MYQLITANVMNWLNLASRYGYKQNYYHAMLLDPPYHLTSITKRFSKGKAAKYGRDGAYQRASSGFMGMHWDGGDLAFNPELWAALKDMLLPGAFCFAFAGSRGWHRMAMAIEDAGFIMHPTLWNYWGYGSGFPKATRIDTQIDKAAIVDCPNCGGLGSIAPIMKTWEEWIANTKDYGGTREEFERLKEPGPCFDCEGTGKVKGAEREKVSNPLAKKQTASLNTNVYGDYSAIDYISNSTTPEAAQWEGHRYGLQSLKPAVEPILCFQKPYKGRPIDSITTTGAGALNIAKGRVKQTSQDQLSGAPSFLSFFFPEPLDVDDIDNHILSSVQDILLNISFALRSYSNDDIDLLHNVRGQDDNLPSDVECAILLAYLFPNGVWCGLDVTSIEDFQSDCRPCRHLYDELFRDVQEAVQGTSPLLADVLEHIYWLLSEPSHSQPCSNNTHSPIQTFALSFINLLYNYIISYSKPPRNSGRWPSNLILSHSKDCEKVGVKRVKVDTGNTHHKIDKNYRGKKGFVDNAPSSSLPTTVYTNPDGNETVDNWQCIDDCPVKKLGEQTGELRSGKLVGQYKGSSDKTPVYNEYGYANKDFEANSGTASRFFYQSHFAYEIYEQIAAADPVRYVAKAGNKERNAGLDGLSNQTRHRVNAGGLENEPRWSPIETKNIHPTLKPIALTKYLASLLLPPKAYEPRQILVPFSGSSSEMIGALLAGWDEVTGIEMTKEYIPIAKARLKWWAHYLKWGQADIETILDAVVTEDEQLSFMEELE